MKITYPIRVLLCSILLVMSGIAQASDSLKSQPGYVDFGDLGALGGAEPAVEISLGRALISFLCAATEEEEPELAGTICKLQSIRISVFEELSPESYEEARKRVNEISDQLEDRDWERAITVKSPDALVRMYMRTHGGSVAGMAVMVIEPGSEAVFMNIVGEIDPNQLGRVASRFGVDLDDLDVD